jgi:dsRNA-specific ribonuclease
LEAIAKFWIYRNFPKASEGFMTDIKINLVKNQAIGRISMEMGLNRWMMVEKSMESKLRNNEHQMGCLFESFMGALFLDFKKVVVKDEDNLFQNTFVTGPGFQMAQKFIENIFEHHIDWVSLIQNDDNYKNILQVKVQKEFKLTPTYLEIAKTEEEGYHMGVYVCLGMPDYDVRHTDSVKIDTFEGIQEHFKKKGKCLVFLGEGKHKIKKKAEQLACMMALGGEIENLVEN